MIMGKGKEKSVSNHDGARSGEEPKILAQDPRGRPQEPLKDNTNKEEAEKIEEEDGKNEEVSTMRKEFPTENVKKKKYYNLQVNKKSDPVTEEIGNVTGSGTDDLTKTEGFRPVGNRRKGKPRRAAGVYEW